MVLKAVATQMRTKSTHFKVHSRPKNDSLLGTFPSGHSPTSSPQATLDPMKLRLSPVLRQFNFNSLHLCAYIPRSMFPKSIPWTLVPCPRHILLSCICFSVLIIKLVKTLTLFHLCLHLGPLPHNGLRALLTLVA